MLTSPQQLTGQADAGLGAAGQPATRRFGPRKMISIGLSVARASGSRVVRSYVFTGGCVNYEFSVGPHARGLEDEAALALDFVPRAEIDARVYQEKHGGSR